MTFPTVLAIGYLTLTLTAAAAGAALTVLWARLPMAPITKIALSIELVAAALLHGTIVPILLGANPAAFLTASIAVGTVVPLLLANQIIGGGLSTPPGIVGAIRLGLLHTLIPVPMCLLLAITGLSWREMHVGATIGADQTDGAYVVGITTGILYGMFSMLRPLARANARPRQQPRMRATFMGEAIADGR